MKKILILTLGTICYCLSSLSAQAHLDVEGDAKIRGKMDISFNNSIMIGTEQKAYLAQNQPNPFGDHTLIDYFIPSNIQKAHVQVSTFDGKVIGKIAIKQTGNGQVSIQSKAYPAGTYLYSLVLDGQVVKTMQMVLSR